MRKLLLIMLVLAALLVMVAARSRVGLWQSTSDWEHLRLSPETMGLGNLSTVEHGYALFIEEAERSRQRIHLIRLSDGHRTSIDPMTQMPEADEVNVFDASVGNSGVVALAVNAISNTTPAPTLVGMLLVYDTAGKLLSAQRMFEPGQESDYILKLAVDDDDSIWAVQRGKASANSTTAPFLYKYSSLGRKSVVIYTRERLPELQLLRPYIRGAGRLSFGMTATSIYCWIPAIQSMVIMAKDGSGMRRVPLGVPLPAMIGPECRTTMFRVCMTESGAPIADVFFERPCNQPNLQSYRGIFAFDPQLSTWRELRYDLPPVALVGVDGERPILMSKWVTPTTLDVAHWLFKRNM